MKITKILSILTIGLGCLIMASMIGFADDSHLIAQQENQEELSDAQVEQILVNQGIPLTRDLLDAANSSKYTLGETDIINIEVMRHSEVSGDFIINNEGKIQYEFVGDIKIEGLTKQEVADLLKEKLSKFIINPEVTVKIIGYNSKFVYVVGEVGRPGKISMHGDTILVREALIDAGLPLLSAKTGDSRLITPTDDGHPRQQKVNVEKLIYQGDLRENLVMQPGDTLYIPPTFLAKALRAIQPIAAPLGVSSGTARTVTRGF